MTVSLNIAEYISLYYIYIANGKFIFIRHRYVKTLSCSNFYNPYVIIIIILQYSYQYDNTVEP